MKYLNIVDTDSHYPRNKLVRQVLMARGNVCEIQAERDFFGNLKVIAQLIRGPRARKILFLQPSQWMLPAILFAKITGATVIVDLFIFLEDTFIGDRRLVSDSSLKAKYYRFLDWCSAGLSDIVFFDTIENRDFFLKEHPSTEEKKVCILPVCVDVDAFPARSSHPDGTFTVLFYGKYIPLQGVSYIVDAARLLRSYDAIRFILVGSGQDRASVDRQVEEYGLKNISFHDMIPYDELLQLLATVDVSLGIFGLSDKANRVIPNKVIEAAACGIPVISGKNIAMARYFTHGENILFCKRGDSVSLAETILHASDNPTILHRIGKRGARVVSENFSMESLRCMLDAYV